MTPQQYLEGILAKYNLKENEIKMIKEQRSYIEYLLKQAYSSKINTFYYSGSYGKGTAINLKYDLDLCIYFNKSAFTTLKEMYYDVFKVLNYMTEDLGECLGEEYLVVKQNVSIGLRDHNEIDIVPAKRIDDDSTNANLYVSETDEHIKTNIPMHIEYISKHKCRPIIKLMKIWKYRHAIHYKSFALELLTIRALDNFDSEDFGDQVLHVLKFIKNNVENVKLVDPANPNNIVSDLISESDKLNMKRNAISSLSERTWGEIIW